MINFKSEKGGVALYVLMAMLLLIITLVAVYVSFTNKHVTNLDTTEQIKAIYEKDLNHIDDIYNNLVNI